MQTEEISERVSKVLRHTLPRLPKAEFEPLSCLTEDMDLNSLETVELVLALEKEFDIRIPSDAVANLRSVGDLVNVVVHRIDVPKPD